VFKPPPVQHHRKRVVRQRARARKAAAVLLTSGPPSRPPDGELQPTTPASVLSTGSDSFSVVLPLLFGIALGLSLSAVAIALVPAWILPRPVDIMVYERRDLFVLAGIATALSIGLGLLIALAAS
jgi:hypothetical protein